MLAWDEQTQVRSLPVTFKPRSVVVNHAGIWILRHRFESGRGCYHNNWWLELKIVYYDAAERKITEPIDYLIKASKTSKSLCILLRLSEESDLILEADALNRKIADVLEGKPIETWETAKHKGYCEARIQPQYLIGKSQIEDIVAGITTLTPKGKEKLRNVLSARPL